MQNMNGHLEEFKYLGKNDDCIKKMHFKIFYYIYEAKSYKTIIYMRIFIIHKNFK